MTDMLDVALEFIRRGWSPIPIPYKTKRPLLDDWPNLRITEENAHEYFNSEAQNVGVRLGELSGGLADVDLDCAEAIHAAGYFLQPTLCFGRRSKPCSHWLYQSDLWQMEDRAAIPFKFVVGNGKARTEQMILELRIGGGGKGAQTVFPGSIHETGELIAWDDEREPTTQADGADLKQRCARAASAALIAGHFPAKGARHDAGLTLGGFLFRCGFSRPDTELFVEAVTIASGQPMEKVKDVRKAAREAWDEGNRPRGQARGFPVLAETFGDDVAKHVAKWLGFSGGSERDPHEAKAPGWNPAAAEQWTELGNAHRLVRCHGDDIRYVHPMEAWLIWDRVFWRRDDSGEIMRRAEATIEVIFDEAIEITDEGIRTAFRKFALKSQSRAQLGAMAQLAQHNLRVVVPPDALDADPMLLGVLNGTIDLNTVKFREGRHEDYITKQCHVTFDPAAQCPNWIEFQKKIAGGNAELVAYKQRVFGLLLTGEMVEILFILHGDGSNGKTTELETIQGVLGDYAHAVDAQLMLSPKDRGGGATPEIVAIKGKRAIFINESGDTDHLNESRVKYLCGNDTMSGRDLFEKPINFRPTHKSFLRTNHKPKIRGTDLGIWRRIHYWPYLVTIRDDEKVVNFRETRLDPERPGILNWMLAGLKDYLAGGLKPPPVVCQATKEYRREMDVTGQWIEAMCERSTIGAKLRLSTLYKSYSKWALDEVGGAVSRQKLAEALREHGFESVLSQGVTVFKNIRLNDDDAEPY